MPQDRLPLFGNESVGSPTNTLYASEFINVYFEAHRDPVLQEQTVWCVKRNGTGTSKTLTSQANGVVVRHYSSEFATTSEDWLFTNSNVTYNNTVTSLGDTDGKAKNAYAANSLINGVGCLAWVDDTNARGWFLFQDATMNSIFTGSLLSGGFTISNITDTTGMYIGQKISGTGIPSNARIDEVISSSQIASTLTLTSAGVQSIQHEAVARIIDSNFPSGTATDIEVLDGYFFASSTDGNIYQSQLNDPSDWRLANVIAADYEGDKIKVMFKNGQYLVVAGTMGTVQHFYNAGNSIGSVLSRATHLDINWLKIVSKPIQHSTGMYVLAETGTGSGQSTSATNLGLYRISGVNNYTKVSPPQYDRILAAGQHHTLGTVSWGGQTKVLIIICGSINRPVLYDPELNLFSSFIIDGAPLISSSVNLIFTTVTVEALLGWNAAGANYRDYTTGSYPAQIMLPAWDGGTMNEKTIHAVVLIADTEASGTASLEWSDNDGATWNAARSIDMTVQFKVVFNCGTTRRRIFRLSHSANTPFRGRSLEIHYSVNNTLAGVT